MIVLREQRGGSVGVGGGALRYATRVGPGANPLRGYISDLPEVLCSQSFLFVDNLKMVN